MRGAEKTLSVSGLLIAQQKLRETFLLQQRRNFAQMLTVAYMDAETQLGFHITNGELTEDNIELCWLARESAARYGTVFDFQDSRRRLFYGRHKSRISENLAKNLISQASSEPVAERLHHYLSAEAYQGSDPFIQGLQTEKADTIFPDRLPEELQRSQWGPYSERLNAKNAVFSGGARSHAAFVIGNRLLSGLEYLLADVSEIVAHINRYVIDFDPDRNTTYAGYADKLWIAIQNLTEEPRRLIYPGYEGDSVELAEVADSFEKGSARTQAFADLRKNPSVMAMHDYIGCALFNK